MFFGFSGLSVGSPRRVGGRSRWLVSTGVLFGDGTDEEMLNITNLNMLLKSSSDLLALIGHESPEDSGQSLVSAYNKAKSRLSSSEVASKLNLSDAELPLFEASLRDFAKRFDAIESDDPDRTTVISALRLASWLETLQSRGVAITIPDFSGLPVDEDVGRKQIRALELILRSLVSERFGGDLEKQLKAIIKPELVDKWKASGDPDDLLSGTTFSELASLVVNKDEFSHYEKLYSHSTYLNYLRDRRKTVQNFLDDVRRVRNVLAHNKSISDAQLQLLELYYEELTSPIQDAFDNGETSVDPSAYLDVSREELQSYFVDIKEDIASVQDELADFRASVEGDLGVIKEDTAVIRETTAGVKSRTTMIAAGVVALLVLVGGSYFFLVGTQENTEAILVDTASIKQTTTETNQAITEVQQSSRRIEGSLDSIQQGFETLSQSGGVIQNPERPEQFYHNARVYEDRGDYLNARKSYNEFFKFHVRQVSVRDFWKRFVCDVNHNVVAFFPVFATFHFDIRLSRRTVARRFKMVVHSRINSFLHRFAQNLRTELFFKHRHRHFAFAETLHFDFRLRFNKFSVYFFVELSCGDSDLIAALQTFVEGLGDLHVGVLYYTYRLSVIVRPPAGSPINQGFF